jgi:GLPGLI family protein
MRFLFLFLFLLILQSNYGQQQGVIKYKQTQYFEFENMPADMPKSNTEYKRMFFDETASRYEKDPDIKIEEAEPEGQRGWMMRRFRNRSESVIYKNLEKEQILEQIGFFGKDFLVSDSISDMKWKVSAGEQKEILGYTCMKAILKDTSSNVLIAFFTPQIALPLGPDKYGQLPGVILEIQSAQTHIIATEVTLSDAPFNIDPPTKGDKKTRKEFNKLRDEKMQEQREMWGGRGGNMRIFRN